MPKRNLTGGGKDLKNQNNSSSYLSKIFDLVKIRKILSEKNGIPANGCNSQKIPDATLRCLSDGCARNTASGCSPINKILTFAAYDKIGGAGPRAQKGPGASVFGLFIYQTVCRKIAKIVSYVKRKPLDRSTLISAAGTSCRGSILIEFAVCMPILIILLFYIHDLVRIKRYYSQTEFVAQQMANILQNIAKKRAAEGTALSKDDFRRAASLAFLSMYPGTTQYSPIDGKWWHEFRHSPGVFCYYVKGSSEGKAKCIWGRMFRSGNAAKPLWSNINNATNATSVSANSKVTYSPSDVLPSQIYPTLKAEDGKPKIILETFLNWDSGCKDLNGNNVSTAREAFGLHFVPPKKQGSFAYFNSVVIFSPNAGFSEVPPY